MAYNVDDHGTVWLHYAIVDPATRTITLYKMPRAEAGAVIRQEVQTGNTISQERMTTNGVTSELHDLYHDASRTTEPFWYQEGDHTAPVPYHGRAVILASNPERNRQASCRMSEKLIRLFIHFDQPDVKPENPETIALFAPARAAFLLLGKGLEVQLAENDGTMPGNLKMQFGYRFGLGALEALARHLDRMINNDDETDSDVITFFTNLHDELVEQGYLNLDERSQLVVEMMNVWEQSRL